MRLLESLAFAIVTLHPRTELPRAQQWASYIVTASGAYDVDPFVVLVRVSVESDWRPWAVGAAGEIGLGQLLPSTAAELWPEKSTEYIRGRLYDQKDNLLATAWYLARVKAECKGDGNPLTWVGRYRGASCVVKKSSRFGRRWEQIKKWREGVVT